ADRATLDERQRLRHQAGLADSRLADDGEQLAASFGERLLPAFPDERELALPADETRRARALRRGEQRGETEGGHRIRLALEHDRLDGLRLDGLAHEVDGGLTDQDLSWSCRLLEPRGRVDRVPGDEALLRAGDDLAGGDPDPGLQAKLR